MGQELQDLALDGRGKDHDTGFTWWDGKNSRTGTGNEHLEVSNGGPPLWLISWKLPLKTKMDDLGVPLF